MDGTRLGRLAPCPEPAARALGPLQFRRMDGWVLAANDAGGWMRLSEAAFAALLQGRLDEGAPERAELEALGAFRERLDFPALAQAYERRSLPLFQKGPNLHMVVTTLRCNQACRYCHSSAVDPGRTDTDMDVETARRVVDFIFSTPNPTLCIEFQGGEPLLNWPVVKFVVEYAKLLNRSAKRNLILALVSNFSLLDDDKLAFLLEHGVGLTTSLDGPAEVHDANRPFLGGGSSHERAVEAFRRVRRRCAEAKGMPLPGALMTTTRFSLPKAREIVDFYASLGMDQVFIRPLSPVGYAKRVWGEVGYTTQDYLRFYDEALSHILELNRERPAIMERQALILLYKILKGEDPGFVDLRSPAGAALACLAYNYDGGIFVSDEGRIASHEGDERFRVGSAGRDRWADVLAHPTTRACTAGSVLESQPLCSQCAYKPYCGVEPVYNYETQGSPAGRLPESGWCRTYMGVFDILFQKLQDPGQRRIFESWLERDRCRAA